MAASAAILAQGIGAFGSAGAQVAGGVFAGKQGRLNSKILERRGQQAFRARLAEAKKASGTAQARAAAGNGTNLSAFDTVARIAEEGRVSALREKFAFDDAAQFEKRRGRNALFEGVLGGGSTLLGASARFDAGPK